MSSDASLFLYSKSLFISLHIPKVIMNLLIKENVKKYNIKHWKYIKVGEMPRMTCKLLATLVITDRDILDKSKQQLMSMWVRGHIDIPLRYLRRIADVLEIGVKNLLTDDVVEIDIEMDKYRAIFRSQYVTGLKDGGMEDEDMIEDFCLLQFQNFDELAHQLFGFVVEKSSERVRFKFV